MSKLKVLVVFAFIIASFAFGVRVGAMSQQYADAQFKAALLIAELNSLKNDDHKKWIWIKDAELDQQISYFYIWENSYHKYFWPELWSVGTEYAERIAKYRKENPFDSGENIDREGAEDIMQWRVREVIKKYAE